MNSFVRELTPYRIGLVVLALVLALWCAFSLNWSWLPVYWRNGMILEGLWTTIWMLGLSWSIGIFIGIWLGLALAAGPWFLAIPAKGFCSLIRGTPLLLQLWFLYYGLGSVFPQFPEIRHSWAWAYLREAWPFALAALTLNFAGYQAEVMRGGFLGVPHGQLEAARAFGMPRSTIFRSIWLPQAVRRVLPTLGGETVLLLKATPLVSTITVIDLYQVSLRIRQDTYIIYEPLLLLALVYMVITALIVVAFRWVENQVPSKLG